MSYYGNYAILIEKQRQEDNKKKTQQLINKIKEQQEGFRRRHQRVYRGPGKNVTEGEANEYMTLMKEYYAKKALREEKKRGYEFKLPKSAHASQKERSQKKFGKKKIKKMGATRQPTYTLKTNRKLLKNRKKRGPSGKILTNKRDYKYTLKFSKDGHFGGRKRKRKTKKCKMKIKTKKRRK